MTLEKDDIDPKLLEILVCPLTKSTLRYDRANQELISDDAGLAFPIRMVFPSCWWMRRVVWMRRNRT
ncbi:hypothetical protein JCM17843_02900 [Kordiimonadales bacterium JCM 17843]|nr:hypothetical protein JCM17843_02900 [Kordiimonadales bacterium JCM 17843]